MITIGSLVFEDSPTPNNRFAELTLDAADDKEYNISLNGTDNNGENVVIRYIVIDNYNNDKAINYNIDNFNSSLAPYTTAVLEVDRDTQNLHLVLSSGVVTIYLSEKKLPVTEGSKYQNSADIPPVTVIKYAIYNVGAVNIVIPADWNTANNAVHCYGSGSKGLAGTAIKGGDGGGSGGYSRKLNLSYAPGASVPFLISAQNSGGDTWFGGTGVVLAHGAAANSKAGAAIGVGLYHKAGTPGGTGANGGGGGGGGGCPGIVGPAEIAGDDGLGGGGGGNGGDSGDSALGGVGNSSNGANGAHWTATVGGATAGGGGGGAGSGVNAVVGGNAGQWGAGGGGGKGNGTVGGNGGDGGIVLQWTPA